MQRKQPKVPIEGSTDVCEISLFVVAACLICFCALGAWGLFSQSIYNRLFPHTCQTLISLLLVIVRFLSAISA